MSLMELGYGLAEIGVQASMKAWREKPRQSSVVGSMVVHAPVAVVQDYHCTQGCLLVSTPWRWRTLANGSMVQVKAS